MRNDRQLVRTKMAVAALLLEDELHRVAVLIGVGKPGECQRPSERADHFQIAFMNEAERPKSKDAFKITAMPQGKLATAEVRRNRDLAADLANGICRCGIRDEGVAQRNIPPQAPRRLPLRARREQRLTRTASFWKRPRREQRHYESTCRDLLINRTANRTAQQTNSDRLGLVDSFRRRKSE